MEEENIKYDTRDEIMAFLKRQREIHTIEECDNIEQIMFDRVRKVLDFRDLMKETRLNFKRTRKLLNKYAKESKKELDVKKLLKKQEEEIEMIESRYVASMIDLIIIVTKALGSELFSNNLTSIESWYEFEAEDLVFVNGFIKALKYWSSFDIDDNMMIRALDVAIDEYVKCIEEDKNYRDLFDKSFMFVSLPKIEEQEGKDE
jgi:hypothetical protein